MVDPILAGIAAGGVTRIAEALITGIYPRLRRISRIRRSIRIDDAALELKSLQPSFESDLRQAFGGEGLLNERSEICLEWLAKSRLLNHLLMASLVSLRPDNGLAFVKALYAASGDGNGVGEPFSDQLWSGICAIAKSLDSTAPNNNNLVRQEDHLQVMRIEAALAKLARAEANDCVDVSDLARKIAQAESKMDSFRRKISEGTLALTREVDVHAPSGEVVRKPLDDVYVEIPVTILPQLRSNLNYILSQNDTYPYGPSIRGWKQIKDRINRTVMLGDPGGGKSTQSKKLCVEFARQAIDGESRTIPIFLQMRTFSALKIKNESYGIIDFIRDTIREFSLEISENDVPFYLDYMLTLGDFFIVFDGLDEVLHTPIRVEISKQIERFCDRYDANRFLITSRVVGYETAPLTVFDHIRMSSLDHASMIHLFLNVSNNFLPTHVSASEQNAERFIADAQHKAPDLISNPLLLTLIIIIHSKKREIPDNRADLYASCAELLFDRWDSYRDITPDLPERYRLYDLLMHTSGILYENEDLGGRLSREELKSQSKNFFIADYIDNREGRAAFAAERLTSHLTGRAWILHEVGENVFEFTHRTFLEYFYAKLLELRHERVEELVDAIAPVVAEGLRTVPAHIALQIRTKDKRLVANRTAELLGAALIQYRNLNIINFCVESVGYLLPSAENISEYAETITKEAIVWGHDAAIAELVNSRGLQADIIVRSVARCFKNVSSVEKYKKFGQTLFSIKRKYGHRYDQDDSIKEIIYDNIVKELIPKQSISNFAVRVVFDLTGAPNWSMVEKFSIRFWMESARYHPYIDTRRDDADALISELQVSKRNKTEGKYTKLFACMWKNLHSMAGKYEFDKGANHLFYSESDVVSGISGVDIHTLSVEEISALCLAIIVRFEAFEKRRLPDDLDIEPLRAALRFRTKMDATKANFIDKWLASEVSLFSSGGNVAARGRLLEA